MPARKPPARKPPAKTSRTRSSLADPTTLQPFVHKPKDSTSGTAKPGERMLQVVIETPRGSRNKYSFDTDQRIFHLKSELPAGMVFPFDFGFLPGTIGGDGDPLDVLVLMDQPAFPGCAVLVRPLGVLEVEQTVHGKTSRNDRILAVSETSQLYANLHSIADLPAQALTEIDQFFINYHRLLGKQSRTLAIKDAAAARLLVQASRMRSSRARSMK